MIEDIFPKGRGGGSEIYNFPEGVEGILRPTKLWYWYLLTELIPYYMGRKLCRLYTLILLLQLL